MRTSNKDQQKEAPPALGGTACSAFWLSGWHRLIHKWDCYAYGNRLSERERIKRGYIAKRFTLAEWRFHEAREPNQGHEPCPTKTKE